MRTTRRPLFAVALAALTAAVVLAAPASAAKPKVGFAPPVRVDQQVGGSEGFVFYSAPHGAADFGATYRNHVPPEWLRVAARFNPVTYVVEGIRSLILDGWVAEPLVACVVVIAATSVVLLGLSVKAMNEYGDL